MNLIYITISSFLDDIGPHYAFIGGEDIRRGVLYLIPAVILLLVLAIWWLIGTFWSRISVKSGWPRFLLWIGIKASVIGLLVGLIYVLIGFFHFLGSQI